MLLRKRNCVKVAQRTLTPYVRVRILLPLPVKKPLILRDWGLFSCSNTIFFPYVFPLQTENGSFKPPDRSEGFFYAMLSIYACILAALSSFMRSET